MGGDSDQLVFRVSRVQEEDREIVRDKGTLLGEGCVCVWEGEGRSNVVYRIAGNFRGRKLSWIGRKGAFRRENFYGMLN